MSFTHEVVAYLLSIILKFMHSCGEHIIMVLQLISAF